MSATSFKNLVWPYCQQVAAATGLSPCLFLCQWAVETGSGSCTNCPPAQGCFNYAGINGSGCGGYQRYSSLSAFAQGEIATLNNGLYHGVLAAAGAPLHTQMIALGNSPWAGGHYNDGGGPGSSLWSTWNSEFAGMGLDCGAVPSSGGTHPKVPPTVPPTTAPPVSVAVSKLGVGLIILGGAAMVGWELHSQPEFRSAIGQADRQAVRWITSL